MSADTKSLREWPVNHYLEIRNQKYLLDADLLEYYTGETAGCPSLLHTIKWRELIVDRLEHYQKGYYHEL
jgi:hypothetical protein